MNQMTASFIFAGLLFTSLFVYLNGVTQRKAATFKLYAVRDRLIILVAQQKLSEDSKIFQYYYTRLNSLIATAPNIGFDDVLNGYIILKKNNNFNKALKDAEIKANEMHKLLRNENEEICDTVAEYYLAAKYMMLAHSNLIRLLYLLLIKLPAHSLLDKFIPENIKNFLKVIRFAESEAIQFKAQIHKTA